MAVQISPQQADIKRGSPCAEKLVPGKSLNATIVCLFLIFVSVDTDHNEAACLGEASPLFQIGYWFFCSFFMFDVVVRLAAGGCSGGSKCGWLCFDAVLTFILLLKSITIAFDCEGINVSLLRELNLLELSQFARLIGVFCFVPELMVLVKAIAVALRSVFFTALLLILVIYTFSVLFTRATRATTVGEEYFQSVPSGMLTLLGNGLLMSDASELLHALSEESVWLCLTFIIFLTIAIPVAFLSLGVLGEVVSSVAAVEKDELVAKHYSVHLRSILESIDPEFTLLTSKDSFVSVASDPRIGQVLCSVAGDSDSLETDVSTRKINGYADALFSRGSGFNSLEDLLAMLIRLNKPALFKDVLALKGGGL